MPRRSLIVTNAPEQRNRIPAEWAAGLSLLLDDAAGYAIFLVDPDNLVTFWNKGAERLLGWTEAEALGQHASLFYTPDANAAGWDCRSAGPSSRRMAAASGTNPAGTAGRSFISR